MTRWLCLVPLAVGAIVYAIFGHPTLPIVQFELAGDASTALDVVDGRFDEFRAALIADWAAFIPGYVITLVLISSRFARRAPGVTLVVLAVVAGACDVVENVQLWKGLDDPANGPFATAATFAMLKFAVLVPAVVLGIWGVVKGTSRATRM